MTWLFAVLALIALCGAGIWRHEQKRLDAQRKVELLDRLYRIDRRRGWQE